MTSRHGPLIRYVKLWVVRAPLMPGTFSPPPLVNDPDMHHGTYVTHVPWCMSGSLTSGFLWSSWRGKRSQHSQLLRNPQFYVSGKRPMEMVSLIAFLWWTHRSRMDSPHRGPAMRSFNVLFAETPWRSYGVTVMSYCLIASWRGTHRLFYTALLVLCADKPLDRQYLNNRAILCP